MLMEAIESIIDRHDPGGNGVFERSVVQRIAAEVAAACAACDRAPVTLATTTVQMGSPGWSGFFKRSVPERQQQVFASCAELDPALALGVLSSGGLTVSAADTMVENCIGTVALPLGLGLNFVLNGENIEAIPMAVEEPSVIAACSGAAKLVAAGGGFQTSTTRNIMIGQIQLIGIGGGNPTFVSAAAEAIRTSSHALVKEGNTFCGSMQSRGGGVLEVVPRVIPYRSGGGRGVQLIVHVHIDVQDAMGANLINTVVEGLSDSVLATALAAAPDSAASTSRCGLRILSNLCDQRLSTARFRLKASQVSQLHT